MPQSHYHSIKPAVRRALAAAVRAPTALRPRAASAVVAAPAIVVKQLGSTLRTASDATGASVLSQAVTAGSYLLIVVTSYESQITSVVGAKNGAFTKLNDTIYGNYNRVTVWGRANAVAGVETITVTPQVPASGYMSGRALELAGIAGFDKATSVGGALAVAASGANVKPNSFVLSAVVSNTGGVANFGTPAGYTLIDRENDCENFTGYQTAYKITSAIETSAATATAGQAASLYNALILSLSGQ